MLLLDLLYLSEVCPIALTTPANRVRIRSHEVETAPSWRHRVLEHQRRHVSQAPTRLSAPSRDRAIAGRAAYATTDNTRGRATTYYLMLTGILWR